MEKESKRLEIERKSLEVVDKLEFFNFEEMPEELIDVFERISTLGSITVLNFNDIEDLWIDRVDSLLTFSNKALEATLSSDVVKTLENLTKSLEIYFRGKKMLLDESIKTKAA